MIIRMITPRRDEVTEGSSKEFGAEAGSAAPAFLSQLSVSACLRGLVILLFITVVAGTSGCRSWILPDLSPRSDIDTLRLERVLDANPENHHAEYMLGRAALEDGNPRRAQRHFSRAADLAPHFEEAHHGIGLALLERNRHRAAFDHYREMADRFPGSSLAHEGMAAAALLLEDHEAAEIAAQEALRLDPSSAQANLVLGEMLYARGDFAGARDHLTRAKRENRALEGQLRPLLQDIEGYLAKYGER